jgi:hypothetical protein
MQFRGLSTTRKLSLEAICCRQVVKLAKHSFKARKKQNFLGDLSNSGPAVRLCREGRATARPEDHYRRRRNHEAVFGCYSPP